jgi:hypothetical protein
VPNIDKYLLPIILLIGALSVAPIAVEVFRNRKKTPQG